MIGLELPALDARLLGSLAGFAEGLGRSAGPRQSEHLPGPTSGHDPSPEPSERSFGSQGLRGAGAAPRLPTSAKRRSPYDVAGVSLNLEDVRVAYAADVSIPEALRAPGAPAGLRCVQRVALRHAAAELRLDPNPGSGPTGRRRRRVEGATAELAGLEVTYVERAVAAVKQLGSSCPGPEPAVHPGSVAAEATDTEVGPEVVARLLAIEHASLSVAAAGQPDRTHSVRAPQEVGSASGLAATADVSGVRARFESEPVFAALQSAADCLAAARAVRSLLSACAEAEAGGAQPVSSSCPIGSRAPGHGAMSADPDIASSSGLGQDLGGAPQRSRAPLPNLTVTVRGAHAEAVIAQDIMWGASLGFARAEAATQSAALDLVVVTLNGRPLATVATAVVCAALAGGPEPSASPWSASDGVAHGPVPAAGLQAGGGSAEPNPTAWVSPAAAAGGPARPFGRRCERLPAALRAAGVDTQSAQTLELNPNPADAPAAGSGAAVVVEAWLEDVAALVPHDQNFGTAERATELWAKAFRQALGGSLAALREASGASAAVDTDGLGAAAEGAAPGAQAPEAPGRRGGPGAPGAGAGAGGAPLLELRVSARRCAFQMQHHPLEAWLAVHAPLLQRCAAARALWGRVLAAVVPTPPQQGPLAQGLASGLGSPSPEGSPDRLAHAAHGAQSRGSPASAGGAVDGCGGGGAGAAADALAAEAAREYRRQCEQVLANVSPDIVQELAARLREYRRPTGHQCGRCPVHQRWALRPDCWPSQAFKRTSMRPAG